FQAEDGIRDFHVTGVQTCALPIYTVLRQLHDPAEPLDISPESAAWRRLAYDEFLAGQIALALVRATVRRLHGRPLIGDGQSIAETGRASWREGVKIYVASASSRVE